MNKIFKFWLSKISKKTKLNTDEKIGYLANELIKELRESGRSIENTNIGCDFGNLNIWVHDLGSDDESLTIESITNNWSIQTKPTFGKF